LQKGIIRMLTVGDVAVDITRRSSKFANLGFQLQDPLARFAKLALVAADSRLQVPYNLI
jgi:hypothetical protein